MSKITLGYWAIRGRAQIPRLLLAYTETEFEDKLYTDPQEWFGKDKQGLGIPFANLPYLIDGDFKLAETQAIILYIIARSKKADQLLGGSAQERATIASVGGVLEEAFRKVAESCYSKNFEEIKKQNLDFVKGKLDQIAKFRGNNEWITGNLTINDFIVAELSYFIEKVYPEEYKQYSFLKEIRERFEALPEIKKYYEGANAVKGPFTSKGYAAIEF